MRLRQCKIHAQSGISQISRDLHSRGRVDELQNRHVFRASLDRPRRVGGAGAERRLRTRPLQLRQNSPPTGRPLSLRERRMARSHADSLGPRDLRVVPGIGGQGRDERPGDRGGGDREGREGTRRRTPDRRSLLERHEPGSRRSARTGSGAAGSSENRGGVDHEPARRAGRISICGCGRRTVSRIDRRAPVEPGASAREHLPGRNAASGSRLLPEERPALRRASRGVSELSHGPLRAVDPSRSRARRRYGTKRPRARDRAGQGAVARGAIARPDANRAVVHARGARTRDAGIRLARVGPAPGHRRVGTRHPVAAVLLQGVRGAPGAHSARDVEGLARVAISHRERSIPPVMRFPTCDSSSSGAC